MKKIKEIGKELLMGALIGLVIGIILGMMVVFVENFKHMDLSSVSLVWIIFFIILSFFLGIFIHELGHLVMGFVTGYSFSSFRFLNLHIQKNELGKLKIFLHFIPGTMGQCLMKPPRKKPLPFFWYNFGGVFFNLLSLLLSVLIILIVDDVFLIIFLLSNTFVNLFFFITNWLPIMGALNDGHNHRITKDNSLTKEAIFYLLDFNARFTAGERLDTYDFKEVEALNLPGDDSIQLNVLLYLANYYQIKFETEKYEDLLELLRSKTQSSSNLITWMILTEYYFMRLLLGYKDAQKYKTEEVNKLMRMLKNNEGLLLMKVYEDFKKEEKLDQNLYDSFLKQAKKSPTPGVAEALVDYSEKLFFIK